MSNNLGSRFTSNMVKLSSKYLIRRNKANKYFLVRKKEDTDENFLKRITHLPLQNQFIEQILQIPHCINVKVLYLQNNLLKNIENIESFPNLTHLYLQRNFLIKLENINFLVHLKKIYLGHNEIQVLEGMDNLKEIKEIHIENQDLSLGDTLYFEPLTIQNLGSCLRVLNISDNYIFTLKSLKNLFSLETLIANNNLLIEIDDITSTITHWMFLKNLSLIGNEVTKNRWYRDSIIFASKSLEVLDNMSIHENTRQFIEKLIKQKNIYLWQQLKNDSNKKDKKKKSLKFEDNFEDNCFHFWNNNFKPDPVYLHPSWKLRNSIQCRTFLSRPLFKKEIGKLTTISTQKQ